MAGKRTEAILAQPARETGKRAKLSQTARELEAPAPLAPGSQLPLHREGAGCRWKGRVEFVIDRLVTGRYKATRTPAGPLLSTPNFGGFFVLRRGRA